MIDILMQLLNTQETFRNNHNTVPIKSFVKSALRCLTSAIRTEPAVNKFYAYQGGISKIIEMLEYVEDQELVANSCKIVRICLRDDIIYNKMGVTYP